MNFASDNTAPVSEEILQAIGEANTGFVPSYGADAATAELTAMMRDTFETDLVAYPVATGTAANALALATLVRPYGAVLCYEEAHIATDECGAPEFYMGGAKLVTLPSPDGRIAPAQIGAAMARARDGGLGRLDARSRPRERRFARAPSKASSAAPPPPCLPSLG